MNPKSNAWNFSAQMEKFGSRINRAQYLWALTAGMLLVAAFLGSFFIQGPWQQQRRILENRFGEEVQRAELLKVLDNLNRQIGKLEEQLLFKGGTPVLTSEVTQLATNFGLEIESVTPKEPLPLSAYRKLQIEVQASATFNNLLLFLRALETHQPLLLVSELEIERRPPARNADSFYPQYSQGPTYPGTAAAPSVPPVEQLDPERQSIRIIIAAFSATDQRP